MRFLHEVKKPFSSCIKELQSETCLPLTTQLTEWAVWPDLVKFRHCDEILKIFGHLLTAKIVFGNILDILRQIIYAIEQILIVVND